MPKTQAVDKDSAGARIKKAGRSLIWVAPNEEEKGRIRLAAAAVNLPMSQFMLESGLREAARILKKLGISP